MNSQAMPLKNEPFLFITCNGRAKRGEAAEKISQAHITPFPTAGYKCSPSPGLSLLRSFAAGPMFRYSIIYGPFSDQFWRKAFINNRLGLRCQRKTGVVSAKHPGPFAAKGRGRRPWSDEASREFSTTGGQRICFIPRVAGVPTRHPAWPFSRRVGRFIRRGGPAAHVVKQPQSRKQRSDKFAKAGMPQGPTNDMAGRPGRQYWERGKPKRSAPPEQEGEREESHAHHHYLQSQRGVRQDDDGH